MQDPQSSRKYNEKAFFDPLTLECTMRFSNHDMIATIPNKKRPSHISGDNDSTPAKNKTP